MDAQQFAYWLQGFAELSGDNLPTPGQWKSIREHLATCFVKVTPPVLKPLDLGGALHQYNKDYLKQYSQFSGQGGNIC